MFGSLLALARSRSRGRFLGRAIGLACLLACASAPRAARADWMESAWKRRPEPFCPIFFGPSCRATMSVDLVAAYQPTTSDDNGRESVARVGLEGAMSYRIGGDFHLGPAFEAGVQDGRFMTGFHLVPKLRARYWIAGSPVSLDISAGLYVGRAWLDTGDAPRNRVGYQMDAGLGVFGSIHLVGGFVVNGDAGGVYGTQTQVFVGARMSLPAVLVGALFGLGRIR